MNPLVMLLFFTFTHTLPLASAHAIAPPIQPCWELLVAQPLPHTPQRHYPVEMEEAGEIIKPGAMLPDLETGFYVYLITSNGEILLAPRYNIQNSAKNLASHKSLLEMYRRHSGAPDMPDMVAAGEFQYAFDEVVEIRNKSGNFRGDPATLELAVEILRVHGLPISERTRISPVIAGEPEDLGHTLPDRDQDSSRIQALKEIHMSMRGQVLSDIYRRMFRLLRETFPNAHGKEAIEKLMDWQADGAKISGSYNGYQTFYFPLQSAFSTDGFEYGIWITENFPDRGGRDGFEIGSPAQINNVVLGGYDKMNPSLRGKWWQLAREFQNLAKLKN